MVICDNWNARKIGPYNIFDHAAFRDEVEELLHKCKDKAAFAVELKRSLMYYFWAKAEWEIVINPWIIGSEKDVKIDVYDQVMLNWDIFVDYVWTH